MKGFLLDENLPYRFRFQPAKPVCHSSDDGLHPTDEDLWGYAKINELVIVTRMPIFPTAFLFQNHLYGLFISALVVYAERTRCLERIWPRLEELLASNKMINVYLDRIEVVA